jgi:hypothetical protein
MMTEEQKTNRGTDFQPVRPSGILPDAAFFSL